MCVCVCVWVGVCVCVCEGRCVGYTVLDIKRVENAFFSLNVHFLSHTRHINMIFKTYQHDSQSLLIN